MIAERAANAAAEEAARRKKVEVPLKIRFLRLLESRSVQHNMTTPTVFHRMLKRRRSIPNKHFRGYQDVSPQLQCRLQCEMVGGSGGDVKIKVVWKPRFIGFPGVLNDLDVTWSSVVEEVVVLPREGNSDSDEEEDDDNDDDDDDDESNTQNGGELDMVETVGRTREVVALERREAQQRRTDKALAALPTQEAKDVFLAASAAKRGPWGPEPVELADSAAATLIVRKASLQTRGCVHRVSFSATHRPSLRRAGASCCLRVAPKGAVWRCEFDEFEPFSDSDNEQGGGGGGGGGREERKRADGGSGGVRGDDEDGDGSDGGSGGPPDPFADINAKPDKADPYGAADKTKDVQAKMNQTSGASSSKHSGGAGPGGGREVGTPGGLVRGKYESDEEWGERLLDEVAAATLRRRARAKEVAQHKAFKLRAVEQSFSVFDADSEQVSGYTRQFLEQERADQSLATSKLQDKWGGPEQDDMEEGSELNLSGKALERDDWDALGWILQRNWGLASLNLSRCALDDGELKRNLVQSVRLNTVLTKVNLSRTRLTDDGAKMCMELLTTARGCALRLKELDLRHCRHMTGLAGRHYHDAWDSFHPSLTKLNGLDLPAIKATKDTLDVSGTALGLPEVQLLALRVLGRGQKDTPAAQALTDVNLSGCGLGSAEVDLVCGTLKRVGKLQIIDLSGNALHLKGAQHVASLVLAIPTLRILRLGHCKLQWAPEMVVKRAHEKQKTKGKSALSAGAVGGGAAGGFDPAVDYDPSALFVLADISKRLKQIEECDLTEEDWASEPARQIRQSLAINRSLAYRRHVDLVNFAVPPFAAQSLKPSSPDSSPGYALTLDVDSKFLVQEKLLHLRSVGVALNAQPLPALPRSSTLSSSTLRSPSPSHRRSGGGSAAADDDELDQEEGVTSDNDDSPAVAAASSEVGAAAAAKGFDKGPKGKHGKNSPTNKNKKKAGFFASSLQKMGDAAGKAVASTISAVKHTKAEPELPVYPKVTFQEGVFHDLSGGTDGFFFH